MLPATGGIGYVVKRLLVVTHFGFAMFEIFRLYMHRVPGTSNLSDGQNRDTRLYQLELIFSPFPFISLSSVISSHDVDLCDLPRDQRHVDLRELSLGKHHSAHSHRPRTIIMVLCA